MSISHKTINDLTICRFNHDHYMKVRKVHELKNKIVINTEFKHYYHEGHKIIEHPLLYKVIRDKETETLYIVMKVLLSFYAGRHTIIQYDTVNGSSGIVHLDNGTSIALPATTGFNDRFDITDITSEDFFKSAEKPNDWFYKQIKINEKVLKHFSECK